MILINCS